MSILNGLKPQKVFYYFEEISKIPRGSGNTRQISDYLVQFAIDNGLEYVQEDIGNVYIYKSASEGFEKADTVILQGHMDMVCEKNNSSDHDFLKDGINLVVKDDFVYADNTTLGADDGIAIAYMLAILSDTDCSHPQLEAVFTVDEETGMEGALALDASKLKGRRIINIDSEEEGILWSSCAGGLRCECSIDICYENKLEECDGIQIEITGLAGGHSGTEINKNRINANCLIGEILMLARHQFDFKIAQIFGGMKDNAIPRESCAIIHVKKSEKQNALEILNDIAESIQKDNMGRESDLKIILSDNIFCEKNFTKECSDKCILLINSLPNGVAAMSADIEDLVETSSNIGVMATNDNKFTLDLSLRSSVDGAKFRLRDKVKYITENIGGRCVVSGDYPAWEYKKDSVLRNVFSEEFSNMFGKEMKIMALHAGLECGILTDKLKGADCVSVGPDIYDIHTPNERMSIFSVERTYNLLLKVLEKLGHC